MLKNLRKHSKTVIWLVVLAFCLWGGYAFSVQFQKHGRIAGEIFGREVTFQDYNLFYNANQIFGFAGKKPPEDPNLLHLQTWQSLIYNYEAKNKNIKVSDDEVRNEVLRLLKDQKIENPSSELYERWLAANFRMTPNEFEKQIREILLIQKLISQFNDQPMDAPLADAIEQQFKREHNSLSLDILSFDKQEDAQSFADEAKKDSKNFEALANKRTLKIQNTGKIALDAMINLWGIPQEIALGLLDKEPGSIEGPVERNQKFSVLRLKEKELAKPEAFTEEVKQNISSRLTNQKKYERFLSWNAEIEARANLKDYTPQAEALTKNMDSVNPPTPPSPQTPLPENQSLPEASPSSSENTKQE